MNLQGITAGYVAVVNPPIAGVWRRSTGFDDSADGKQVPTYATDVPASLQVQAATGKDLEHIDAVNLQGVYRSIYMQGAIEGVNRPAVKGGDLIVFNGFTWLVLAVIEPWDTGGWCKLLVVEQND